MTDYYTIPNTIYSKDDFIPNFWYDDPEINPFIAIQNLNFENILRNIDNTFNFNISTYESSNVLLNDFTITLCLHDEIIFNEEVITHIGNFLMSLCIDLYGDIYIIIDGIEALVNAKHDHANIIQYYEDNGKKFIKINHIIDKACNITGINRISIMLRTNILSICSKIIYKFNKFMFTDTINTIKYLYTYKGHDRILYSIFDQNDYYSCTFYNVNLYTLNKPASDMRICICSKNSMNGITSISELESVIVNIFFVSKNSQQKIEISQNDITYYPYLIHVNISFYMTFLDMDDNYNIEIRIDEKLNEDKIIDLLIK